MDVPGPTRVSMSLRAAVNNGLAPSMMERNCSRRPRAILGRAHAADEPLRFFLQGRGLAVQIGDRLADLNRREPRALGEGDTGDGGLCRAGAGGDTLCAFGDLLGDLALHAHQTGDGAYRLVDLGGHQRHRLGRVAHTGDDLADRASLADQGQRAAGLHGQPLGLLRHHRKATSGFADAGDQAALLPHSVWKGEPLFTHWDIDDPARG